MSGVGHELSELEREGRRRIMRKFYGDGRWGRSDGRYASLDGEWTMLKRRPRRLTWARTARASNGRATVKVHAVKYQLEATHRSGYVASMTVWVCGGKTNSAVVVQRKPTEVCGKCWSVLHRESVVKL